MAKEETKKTAAKKTTKKEVKKTTSKPKKKTVSKTTPKTSKTQKDVKKTTKTASTKKQPTLIQEENSYGRTIIAAILIALIFLSGYLVVRFKGNENGDANYKPTADEIAFKEDYESLNGSTYSDGTKIQKVEIMADNNIEYISMERAVEILYSDSESGVIYFGFASCEYCRNSVPVLLEAMKSSELDKIYYVNIRPEEGGLTGVGGKETDLRDEYDLDSKNKAKRIKEASDPSYSDLVTVMASYLDDYVLVTKKGKEVPTGTKRLYAPTIVAVKKGEIVGYHSGTVEGHETDENGVLKELSKEQKKELLKEYTNVISSYLK